jgi:hypothetical protein
VSHELPLTQAPQAYKNFDQQRRLDQGCAKAPQSVKRLSLTDDELAAVAGHEMGHSLLEHGQEVARSAK